RYTTQAGDDLVAFFSGHRIGVDECLHPRDRSFDILFEQFAVVRERVVEPPEKLRRRRPEPPAPHFLGHCCATFRNWPGDSSSSSRRGMTVSKRLRPRSGSPNSLMKPAESVTS